ncbi:L-seryl-tRNA(Sec) kinase-like [Anneissia japonica]|uniref:L-seryl-tRNA(Sec) kinase-like n=1 Tax=Anneissia japonica TaxID=1529436 RepID=UPI0014254F45|nr:L-seryl-tRNA(Sec) kinase-like [Anneissia japonica]
MTRRCLILILCGIPGAGKSTLASNLERDIDRPTSERSKRKTLLRATVTTWICFDDVIPHSIDVGSVALDTNGITKDYGIWKAYRLQIVKTIDDIISKVINGDISHFYELPEQEHEATSISKHVEEIIKTAFKSSLLKYLDQNECGNTVSREGDKNKTREFGKKNDFEDIDFVFVMDDNFYYRSMRYQYFQICRKYNIAFCQIHMHCSVDVALERNSSRNNRVPDDTIINMATRFEAPDVSKGSWEEMSLQIDAANELIEDTWISVSALLCKALDYPVQPMIVEDQQQKEQSRQSCLRSLIHQGDQILRRLITERMKLSKETGMEKSEMKMQSEKLNQARQEILKSLRDANLSPPPDEASYPSRFKIFLEKLLDDHKNSL